MPLAKAARKIKVLERKPKAPQRPEGFPIEPIQLAALTDSVLAEAKHPVGTQLEAVQRAEVAEVAELLPEAQPLQIQAPPKTEPPTEPQTAAEYQPPLEPEVQPPARLEAQLREAQPLEPLPEAVASGSEPRVAAVQRATQPAESRTTHRRFKVPHLRLRSTSRLEGVELPLPPMRGETVRVASGYLVLGDGIVRVYAEREGPWGPLQPLVDYRETQEIFISEHNGIVHITAGISGKRYEVELPRELVVERLAQRIAITAGIPLSERNPQDSGEYHGWRVNLAIPQIAGGWQISAARVVKVEPLRDKPLLLARLVTLAAAPNSLIFVGPPGSGKTTALIGVLNAILELWPKLRVSIVEEEPEVAVQVSGSSVVRYFSFGDRTVTANIRATRRYDRPDLLVVGELRGEEVPSWFEAAGSGIPVLTTAHSVGLTDALKRLDALIQASGLKASVLDAVRVWVVCGKTVSSSGIERGVKAVYVVTGGGIQPVYKAGRYLPEEGFLELLPPELQLELGGKEAKSVYSAVKGKLGAGETGALFERMEPLPYEELLAE